MWWAVVPEVRPAGEVAVGMCRLLLLGLGGRFRRGREGALMHRWKLIVFASSWRVGASEGRDVRFEEADAVCCPDALGWRCGLPCWFGGRTRCSLSRLMRWGGGDGNDLRLSCSGASSSTGCRGMGSTCALFLAVDRKRSCSSNWRAMLTGWKLEG